jgi:HSP20 family protein
MTTVKRNSHLLHQFPLLFDDFLNRDVFNPATVQPYGSKAGIPAVNIMETTDDYAVEVAAPGLKKEDFKIQLEGNILTISSEKNHEKSNGANSGFRCREFSYQFFHRSFVLQNDVVDIEKISARYEQGILYLQIPKKETAKKEQTRLIAVS